MKVIRITAVLVSLLFCLPAIAQTTQTQQAAQFKPCEELKNEIDAKMREKGVENYTLDIVANDEVENKTVVGSCNGGKNKIVYTRGR